MLADLGYAKRQILFARGANGRMQHYAVEDALSRALDAIERIAEELQRPAPEQLTDIQWADIMDDDLEAIFGEAAERSFIDHSAVTVHRV